MINTLKKIAKDTKVRITALYLVCKNPAVPKMAKWLGVAVVAYALSPIDLIPDFIPIIGYLDELIILPIGIYFAVKLIPPKLWLESLRKAKLNPIKLSKNYLVAIVIVSIWIICTGLVGYYIWTQFQP